MNINSVVPISQTEHLTIAELLGIKQTYEQFPQGWEHPKAIAQIAIGSKVFVKNLKTREWEIGTVQDYWELGRFLDVHCGKRRQMVFSCEHIAVKSKCG